MKSLLISSIFTVFLLGNAIAEDLGEFSCTTFVELKNGESDVANRDKDINVRLLESNYTGIDIQKSLDSSDFLSIDFEGEIDIRLQFQDFGVLPPQLVALGPQLAVLKLKYENAGRSYRSTAVISIHGLSWMNLDLDHTEEGLNLVAFSCGLYNSPSH